MKKMKLLTILSAFTLAAAGALGLANLKNSKKAEVAKADYSSTIRVYVDLNWGNIDYVRLGTDQASGNAALTTSNAKYNQDLGKYVRDISSASTYDKMGFFFSQSSQWWQYQYDGGYVWISGGFKPGYEYQIKNIDYVSESGGVKYFAATPYEIGEIRDNAQNSTFYFVDGYSWHSSRSVTAYFWGGTASCAAFPGNTMTDSGLRLKAYVGDTEYSGLQIFKYTLSGSAAYVKFSNNNGGQETGDLELTDSGIYFYGVEDSYKPVIQLLITLNSQLGSYTYKGRSFANSICHLSQSQAQSFVSTYNTLESTGTTRIASSVAGSGLVTYDQEENNSSHTGEVSLSEVKTALVKKYSLSSSGSRLTGFADISNNETIAIIVIVSLVSVSAVGGFFFIRKRKSI